MSTEAFFVLAARPAPLSPQRKIPFQAFVAETEPVAPSRRALERSHLAAESERVGALLPEAGSALVEPEAVAMLAKSLAATQRSAQRDSGVLDLLHEYQLSSQEGVALMCLAEALLRTPDPETRDRLIRDKLATGQWQAHVGGERSWLVSAAGWGLLLTGRLVATRREEGHTQALERVLARLGEPVIRLAVDRVMRLLGEHFVLGQSIESALHRSRRREAQGFRYSYDMLGEAALTAADAERYFASYESAIHAIGERARGLGPYAGPGISIKLSALHPRFQRAQRTRVLRELWPRLRHLALLARDYDMGLNIDAEESWRLDLSLDLFEALCADPGLRDWLGLGFVVQAYQKRAPALVDALIAMAKVHRRRLMVRLVKGAYWDTEIKRAQQEGLADYPVYTRKPHTDLSYRVCARRLLAAPEQVFAQLASHNARSIAEVQAMAGPYRGEAHYEFQCLHGMGEGLFEKVVAGIDDGGLGVPCRIYAPVGSHETLLAYLVRRLLENGANTSFIHQLADPTRSLDDLVADPWQRVRAEPDPGAPHPAIALPTALYAEATQGGRLAAAGVDLHREEELRALVHPLRVEARREWHLLPAGVRAAVTRLRPRLSPADERDVVGMIAEATPMTVPRMVARANRARALWAETPVAERVRCLRRAADLLESDMAEWLGLLVREAGKTLPNALAELREAVDFLRDIAWRAEQQQESLGPPLGLLACISPWNFPVAIFAGQIAAALAAGNVVIAKPAEQTPLLAARTVRVLHDAGIPAEVLQLLPGSGPGVGGALVAHAEVDGVMFTGSTEVAHGIAQELAKRPRADGLPVPLVAETGGQNAMIVDSSALIEQVVHDILVSAFDSAGQRCSALRLLCVQDSIAEPLLTALRGAMAELEVGHPESLSVDVGPVIDEDAALAILQHIERHKAAGNRITQTPLPPVAAHGHYVPPTLIEIPDLAALGSEVFGPVLHVLRFRAEALGDCLSAINGLGYALTFGVQSRVDETIEQALDGSRAGNAYVNRNMIGAVVGSQPFGGEGLSGTGPKAGGPLMLRRLCRQHMPLAIPAELNAWLMPGDVPDDSAAATTYLQQVVATTDPVWAPWLTALRLAMRSGLGVTLPGPTGERNRWQLRPRGRLLCVASTLVGVQWQLAMALVSGNRVVWPSDAPAALTAWRQTLPAQVSQCIDDASTPDDVGDGVLIEAWSQELEAWHQQLAERAGPIVRVLGTIIVPGDLTSARVIWDALFSERVISTNTAAAGGNAQLMSLE